VSPLALTYEDVLLVPCRSSVTSRRDVDTSTRLTRERAIPVRDTLVILGEVADALASAHHQGIVHRDIKPENILLDQGHAVVMDFGVAKALHRSLDGSGITGSSRSGHPRTWPEQAVSDPTSVIGQICTLGVAVRMPRDTRILRSERRRDGLGDASLRPDRGSPTSTAAV
jgi:serine/threonine protein kinase